MRRSKGYYFLRIHTCPLQQRGDILGHSLASGHSVPHHYLKDDILSGPSSVVNMGEWLQDTGQFLSVSTPSAARCLLVSLFLFSLYVFCISLLFNVRRGENLTAMQLKCYRHIYISYATGWFQYVLPQKRSIPSDKQR